MVGADREIRHFAGEFAYLSNFFPAEVVWDGAEYPTIEDAYQAAKTVDPEERRRIRALRTPGQAKRHGSRIKVRPGWEEMKLEVMASLLRDKFTRHAALREKLLATGSARLVEVNPWVIGIGECRAAEGRITWAAC